MTKMTSFRGLSEEQVARVEELAKAEGTTKSKWLLAAVLREIARAEADMADVAADIEVLSKAALTPAPKVTELPGYLEPSVSRADAFRRAQELAAQRRRQGKAKER